MTAKITQLRGHNENGTRAQSKTIWTMASGDPALMSLAPEQSATANGVVSSAPSERRASEMTSTFLTFIKL